MTLLDTIQTLSGGPVGYGIGGGAILGALIPLLRTIPGFARRMLDVWVSIREKRADAEHTRARAKQTGNEVAAMRETNFAALLQEVRDLHDEVKAATVAATAAEAKAANAERRVTECEERHQKAAEQHAEALALRDRRLDAQARAIAQLTEKVRALGGTPPDMQAVTSGRESKG